MTSKIVIWQREPDGAIFGVDQKTLEGYTITRHPGGRKYWGVTYPDHTYTHSALTLSEAKQQAEAWEPDPTLVELEVGQPSLTEQLLASIISEAEPLTPTTSYYGYNTSGEPQRKALGALRDLRALRELVETAIREQVAIARTNTGSNWSSNAATWEHVGQALGVTKQSVASRYGVKSA